MIYINFLFSNNFKWIKYKIWYYLYNGVLPTNSGNKAELL